MIYQSAIWRQQQADLLRYGVRTIVDVTVEPVTLEEARQHLRVDVYEEGSPPVLVSDDDAWIEAMLPAAREYCEQYLGRALATRTMKYQGNAFPTVTVTDPPGPVFVLPFGPVQDIISVEYDDIDGVGQAVPAADYRVDPILSVPARLLLAYGSTWPTARSAAGSVRVVYVTGFSTPGESPQVHVLPKLARAAILLMLGHLFENREATSAANLVEIPLGVAALLDFIPRERLGVS